jgi:hypothetical protein
MDPSDSSQNRRKIPAVSDVVVELSKRLLASPEQQPMLFRAAQQVCAEELRLVRTGFRSAPFDELVERAIRLLPGEMAREESPRASESSAFPEPEPFDTIAAPSRAERSLEEGPFSLDAAEALESYEPPIQPPKPASGPVRPLEISENLPPAPPAKAPPYGEYLREPRKDRHASSISATRVLIFLALVGAGFASYRLAHTGRWPFRGAAFSSPKKPAPERPQAPGMPAKASVSAAPTAAPPPAPAEKTASVPVPAPKVGGAPFTPARRLPGAPNAPNASSAPNEPGASTPPESRGSSMISSDWNGRAPAYMIHFSSYQKRENAERDQARLSKLVGRPFHVIEINLGREGAWFRVMLGDFASRDEALAFRQQLADRNTPGMGLVYKVSGTR